MVVDCNFQTELIILVRSISSALQQPSCMLSCSRRCPAVFVFGSASQQIIQLKIFSAGARCTHTHENVYGRFKIIYSSDIRSTLEKLHCYRNW